MIQNQWLDIISGLYKKIQKNRAEIKEKATKYSLKTLSEIEDRLIKQQTLIKESWSI